MNEVKGKAKNLFAISGKRFKVPCFLYVDQASLNEALRTIPTFETRRQKCAMNVNEDELRSIKHHLSQSPAPGQLRTRLSALLQKNRNKKWIVRTSFGVKTSEEGVPSPHFGHEIISAASSHDLGCAVMRVSASLFDPGSWTRLLATGQNPARCELGIIVQEFIQGTLVGTAYRGHTLWGTKGQRAEFEETPHQELAPFWRKLKAGMRALEHQFQGPVKAEWAFDGQQLWWLNVESLVCGTATLQSRANGVIRAQPNRVADCFPRVTTSMGLSLLEETIDESKKSIPKLTGIYTAGLDAEGNFGLSAIAKNLVPGIFHFIALIPNLFSSRRSQFRARFLHRVLLAKASKRVLERWKSELEKHLSAIRDLNTELSTPEECARALNLLRTHQIDYFRAFASISFLAELNTNLMSTACKEQDASHSDFECADLQQMNENARFLQEASNMLCSQASVYRLKAKELLESIGHLLIERGVIERSEDIYTLTVQELQAYLERTDFTLKHLVNERTERLEAKAAENVVSVTESEPSEDAVRRPRKSRKVFYTEECVATNAV